MNEDSMRYELDLLLESYESNVDKDIEVAHFKSLNDKSLKKAIKAIKAIKRKKLLGMKEIPDENAEDTASNDIDDAEHFSGEFSGTIKIEIDSENSPTIVGVNTINKQTNLTPLNKRETTMLKVEVMLVDNSKSLDPRHSIVKNFGSVIVLDSLTRDQIILQVCTEHSIKEIIEKHNEVRAKQVDLLVRANGGDATCLPVEVHELDWNITRGTAV